MRSSLAQIFATLLLVCGCSSQQADVSASEVNGSPESAEGDQTVDDGKGAPASGSSSDSAAGGKLAKQDDGQHEPDQHGSAAAKTGADSPGGKSGGVKKDDGAEQSPPAKAEPGQDADDLPKTMGGISSIGGPGGSILNCREVSLWLAVAGSRANFLRITFDQDYLRRALANRTRTVVIAVDSTGAKVTAFHVEGVPRNDSCGEELPPYESIADAAGGEVKVTLNGRLPPATAMKQDIQIEISATTWVAVP